MSARKIAVVIPGYNHADFIGAAIASVLAQDWPAIELHVLDDGSTDDTAGAAERAVATATHVRCRVERQQNQGSARALNRLIDRVDADYVAILNSDDVYHPGRLRSLAERAEGRDLFFGFTGVDFVRSDVAEDAEAIQDWYSSKLEYALTLPTCGYAILAVYIAITSSNHFFSRELFDLVGGFDPALTLTQDWDFAVEALRWTEPTLLPGRLLSYRFHPGNSWRALQDLRREQSEQVLRGYAEWAREPCLNPLSPTPSRWPAFFPYFARVCRKPLSQEAIGASLPPEMMSPENAGGTPSQRDQAAVSRLVASARNGHVGLREPETMLAAAAAQWEAGRPD